MLIFFPPHPKLFNILGSQNSFKETLAPGGMLQAPRDAVWSRGAGQGMAEGWIHSQIPGGISEQRGSSFPCKEPVLKSRR